MIELPTAVRSCAAHPISSRGLRRNYTQHREAHHAKRRVRVDAAGSSPSTDVTETSSSKCPVLRSVQELPERKMNPILVTLSLFFTDAFTAHSNLVKGDPIARLPSANGDSVMILGDANLVREVMSDDETWLTELPIKAFLGEEGVLFLSGEQHTRVRGLMATAFSAEEIEKYTPRVQDLATKCLDKAVVDGAAGKKLTALDIMHSLTFDIICTVVTGLKLSEEEFQAMLNDYKCVENSFLGTVLPIPRAILNLPFMPGGMGMAARQRILDRVQSNVAEAEARWEKGESLAGEGLLQELIAAGLQDPKKKLTHTQLGDNAMLFLLAGFDTTASLITSMMYYMDKYPHHWQAVVQEQEQIAVQFGQGITPQILRKMEVTERFVRETLRLRSPAAQNMRMASRDTVLGDVMVPKGWKAFTPVTYINTVDPTFTTNKTLNRKSSPGDATTATPLGTPTEGLTGGGGAAASGVGEEDVFGTTVFNPDRFLGVNGSGQQMAFGYGKHFCLGYSLAMVEAKVVLAVLARRYEVKVTEEPKGWQNIPIVKPGNNLPVLITLKNL